ncbi:MAG TPA: hypothetical protein VI485_01770 [Vicinamibacterales bacterium]|nr:hypothetical protein [Vicinamibacterales bacterium]
MAITLRFYGRFIFARHANGTYSVLAPTFDLPFEAHRALMSIPQSSLKYLDRDNLIGLPAMQITTLQPLLRTASHTNPLNPQVVVWDLAGLHVWYTAAAPANVTLTSVKGDLIDLATIETVRTHPSPPPPTELLPESLRANDSGVTTAVIAISQGTGTVNTACNTLEAFVDGGAAMVADLKERHPDVNIQGDPVVPKEDPQNPGSDFMRLPAEIVEFSMTGQPGPDGPVLTLQLTNNQGDLAGLVSVRDGTTISFSNLCAAIRRPGDSDLEFSRYYALLQTSPGGAGLVPHEPTATSEGPCCICAATLSTAHADTQ